MDPNNPTDREDMQGLAVALLRAYQLGDESAFDALMSTIDEPLALVACLAGMLDTAGAAGMGRERWELACSLWRPGQRLGEGLDG